MICRVIYSMLAWLNNAQCGSSSNGKTGLRRFKTATDGFTKLPEDTLNVFIFDLYVQLMKIFR